MSERVLLTIFAKQSKQQTENDSVSRLMLQNALETSTQHLRRHPSHFSIAI